MRTVIGLLLAASTIAAAAPAYAQADSSVVVMRRALDPKTRTFAWIPGEWSQCSNSCGAGQQTRSVQCMMNGKHGAPDVNCGPDRPADVQTCYDVQACSYTWNPSDWSDVKGCGQVVETRTLTCDRSDGQTVSNDQCPKPAPDTARTVNDLRTCSYSWKAEDWGGWSDYCRTGAERARQVYCLRSNGEKVGDEFCSQQGAKPAGTETADRYEQCGYAWEAKNWGAWSSTCQTGAQRTRQVTCKRSNGDTVADALCASAGDRPEISETGDRYEGCSYSWKAGSFGAIAPACGASTSTRTVECLRSNGDVVADASCDAASRPSETQAGIDYSTCSYDWSEGSWSAPSSSCGAATATRDVTCRSSDGRTVGDSFCSTAKPATSKSTYETSGCSHAWKSDAWGAPAAACGATVQNRNVWCLRSDGQTVADSACDGASKPASQQGATDYGTCTYGWNPAAWSAPSTTCGQASYTRSVTCLSSDGRTVSDASCSGQKPEATKSDYQTSGCGYSWKAEEWNAVAQACGASYQVRSVYCLRSDGEKVADGQCATVGSRPEDYRTATDYSTCTYGWSAGAFGAWSSSCGTATQTRSVSCQSSDGRTVADSFCSTAKPESSQTSYQTAGCARTWNAGAWSSPDSACSAAAVQSRPVTCQRSDGQTVADAECTAAKPATTQTVASYDGCQPYWYAASGWSDWNSHCSASAVRSRDIGCFRYEERCVLGSANYWADAGNGNCFRKIDNAQCSATPNAAREGFSPSMNTETSAVYDQCGYTWQTGAFGAPAAACGASVQYRDVWCLRSDGTRVADGSCGGGKPATQQGATDYSTCSYSWNPGGWSAPSSTCGAATQTRSVTCLRSDGTTVADGSCNAATRPAASQASTQTTSCTYSRVSPSAWSGWDNACSGSANRTRTYSCQRSDGTAAAASECTSRGISLTETETGANYTNACPGYFSVGGWSDYNSHCSASATRTRNVACYRSGDNVFAGDQYCIDRGVAVPARSETAAVYDQCGYSWRADEWGAAARACGASTQTRNIYCIRSDGTWVPEGNCNAGTRPATSQAATDYSACSFSWAYNGWGTTSQTCGSVSQSRSVWCQRSDGATVAEGYCGGGKPAASQTFADYSACTYARGDYTSSTDWNSHCSPTAYRYNYYNCKRADGTVVANAECTNRGISLTEQQGGSVLDQCGYSVNSWSGYSYASSCSTSTTATQYATGCLRSDGAQVAIAECSNRGIPTTQSVQTSNLSGCGYTWQAGGWSGQQAVCTTGTEYRDVWCQRTDGTRVDGSLCGAGQPASSQGYSNANACGYAWYESGFGGWNSTCSASATRTQTVFCRRSDGTQVADGYCGGAKPASSQSTPIYSGCSYSAGYGDWSACPAGANATQSRSTSCTRVQTGEQVDQQTYCGIPAVQSQGCTINPGGYTAGTTLGTYAFATCSQQYDYGTMGTMPGVNPALCKTGVATYAQQCTTGGNFATNASCTGKPWVNNPRGPTGYPCDIVCR